MATTIVFVCMVHVYHIRSTFGGDFIIMCIMKHHKPMYTQYRSDHQTVHQFVFRSDLPNLMFAKYTAYTICEHELLKNSCKFVNIFY